ncbi:hypothetical protein PUR53_15215, partial [Streptomyces sp. SP18BB07]|nr:hypothetical protein [Streptomyces sp. SP18BB07]
QLTFTSGLVLSLGTPWGLARHRWVYTKYWLTLATLTATVLAGAIDMTTPRVLDHVRAVTAAGAQAVVATAPFYTHTHPAEISIPFSLGFIVLVLAVTTVTSLWASKKQQEAEAAATPA